MSDDAGPGLPRRQLLPESSAGLLAVTAASRPAARGRPDPADGTPEQVHLTWCADPTQCVIVSWASPGQAIAPRVRIGQRDIPAVERSHADGPSGEVTWTYHARIGGLRPGATYGYAVTADNDANAADPFSATFTTAPGGRAAFRFTSFGDLATPNPPWASSHGQAAYAAGAVEAFQPLFHLLGGDLAHASLSLAAQPRAWRDFGNNVQSSAAHRPWMPAPGNHESEFGNGADGLASYLTRYTLPANGVPGFEGRWYSFRIGTAVFISLSGDDVAHQDAGPPPVAPGTSRYAHGYSGGAQSRWLEATLATARQDASVDWIVIQLHQGACSSAPAGYRSGLGIRREWLPLFDRYEVDLVLSGHGHGYERSFPVRGVIALAGTDAATGAPCPKPVTTVDSGVFDTSQGTVHLVLGCGGAAAGSGSRGAGHAVEAAPWSARRDTTARYGIAVFDVSPGTEAGGQTSITVRYYHAVGADPVDPATGTPGQPTADYTLFETFTLVRPRSDGRRWHPK